MQITRFTAVIKAERFVHFPAAAAEVHAYSIVSAFIENAYHAAHIHPVSITFQAMQDHYQPFAAHSAEIEVEKIVVLRSDACAGILRGPYFPEKRRKDGLQVPVP